MYTPFSAATCIATVTCHFLQTSSIIDIEPLLACVLASVLATNITTHRDEYQAMLDMVLPRANIVFFTLAGVPGNVLDAMAGYLETEAHQKPHTSTRPKPIRDRAPEVGTHLKTLRQPSHHIRNLRSMQRPRSVL